MATDKMGKDLNKSSLSQFLYDKLQKQKQGDKTNGK